MAKKKNKQKKIGRPNPFLYALLYCFFRPFYALRYGVRFDNATVRGIKGPALVIAPHTSNKDHWLIGMALYPTRPTFVVSEHFMRNKFTRFFMKLAHTVTKKMFCADVSTVMNLLRAKREGNVIVLFPEGRLSCNGRTGKLTEGTAALAKKLGVDIYRVAADGASLTFPKWAKKPRKGRIVLTGEKLMTAEEVASASLEELEERLQAAIVHDDASVMQGIYYRSKQMAEGLDGVLYRCPNCGAEFALTTKGDTISCPCGMQARLTPDYRMEGVPYSTILEWYDAQAETVDPDVPMTSEVRVGTPDEESGLMNPEAGSGVARMDRSAFSFDGEVNGEKLSFSIPLAHLAALPITVASHFDVYYANRLYYIYPQPDERTSVKWVAWLDRLKAEENAHTLSAK